MENKKQLSPEETKEFYFEFQSVIGVTTHMGGLRATEELIESCRIGEGKHVLEVGCGVGATPCYVAKRYGCRVVGVDISERMIGRSRERARREGVGERIEFRVADARNLPFEDATFDAVIGESVTTFAEDKRRAVSEYARVTRPGGYVGFNECTWIKAPPPGVAEYLSRALGAEILTSSGWEELLEGSGLENIVVRTHKTSALSQWANEIRQLGFKDLLKAWREFLFWYARNPALRRYVNKLWPSSKELIGLLGIFKCFGYGIYFGRKKKR